YYQVMAQFDSFEAAAMAFDAVWRLLPVDFRAVWWPTRAAYRGYNPGNLKTKRPVVSHVRRVHLGHRSRIARRFYILQQRTAELVYEALSQCGLDYFLCEIIAATAVTTL